MIQIDDTPLLDAMRAYGIDMQMDLATEETAEFIVALSQYKRGRGSEVNVVEELADATIMLRQMTLLFGEDKVQDIVNKKIYRLQERLDAR